ncbi:histone methyltransferase set1 [Thecaphora frezii]
MPAASSSSRSERWRQEGRYASDYSSRKRYSSPYRGDSSSRDDRYVSASGSSSRNRAVQYDDGYDHRHSSSYDTDGWEPLRNRDYELDRSQKASSSSRTDDRYRSHGSGSYSYDDDPYGRSRRFSPPVDRGGSYRDRSDHAYPSSALPDDLYFSQDDWRQSDRDRRRSGERRRDDGRSSRPRRRDDDYPSDSDRRRSRSRDPDRPRGGRSGRSREREERRRSPERTAGRRLGRPDATRPLSDGEEGELTDVPRHPSSRSAKILRKKAPARPLGEKPGYKATPPIAVVKADSVSATALGASAGSRQSPKSQVELLSPLGHSSPSPGSSSTPRPEMPSPATTVDSKATTTTEDLKGAKEDVGASYSQASGATAALGRSEAGLNGASTAAAAAAAAPPLSSGPSAWRRITGDTQRAQETGQPSPVSGGSSNGAGAFEPAATISGASATPTGPRALRVTTPSAAPATSSHLQVSTAQTGSDAAAASAKANGNTGAQQPVPLPKSRAPSSPSPPISLPMAGDTQPQKPSFGHVPLPSEMEVELRAKNFLLAFDPHLSKDQSKGKRPIKREKPDPIVGDGAAPAVVDPRLAMKHRGQRIDQGRKKLIRKVVPVTYEWDKQSVGPRPPPPPRELLVIGLSPLTTQGQLSQQFRGFGRVEQLDLKLDPTSGQSLGIFSLTYAHDYDEDGKPLKEAAAALGLQDGHEAAKAALKAMQGRRIGTETITVSLDRDRAKYKQAYRLELQRRYQLQRAERAAQSSAAVAAKDQAAAVASTAPAHGRRDQAMDDPSRSDSVHSASMPPPIAPRASRTLLSRSTASDSPLRASSSQHFSRGKEYSNSPLSGRAGRSWRDGRSTNWHEHTADPPDGARSRYAESGRDSASSRGSYGTAPHHRERRSSLASPLASYDDDRDVEDDSDVEETTERVLRRLAGLGYPYVYVARPNACDISVRAIRRHFCDFSPALVTADRRAFYVGFGSRGAASRARMVLDKKALHGYHITLEVRDAPSAEIIREEAQRSDVLPAEPEPPGTAEFCNRRRNIMGQSDSQAAESEAPAYTPNELAEATFALIQRDLAERFIRHIKSRVVAPLVADFLRPSGAGGQILARPPPTASHPAANGAASSSRDEKLPSFRKVPGAAPRKSDLDFDIPKKSSTNCTNAPAKMRSDKTSDANSKATKSRILRDSSDGEASSSNEHGQARRSKSAAKAGRASEEQSVGESTARRRLPDFSDEDEEAEQNHGPSRSISASVEPSELAQTDRDVGAKTKLAKKPAKKKAKSAALPEAKDKEASRDPSEGLIEQDGSPAPAKAIPLKKDKHAKAMKSASLAADPIAAGIAEDEEDLYYFKAVLERRRQGLPLSEQDWHEDEPKAESQADISEEGAASAGAAAQQQPVHLSGSARTEGFYRIPAADKAAHLPDRNKKSEQETPSVHALATARNNRADSRRLVLGIEQHKKETASDTDIFKINQLRTRKKQLKFAKSPIHDWGLYAMEKILPGDMVIEYVGEVVRQQVADEREKQYERQGNFSTYLFRVDDDLVVDATHKGNIARLMNHCCTPNCNAKILTLNGEKRIVLFARTLIEPGDELTYDYKFQASADDEDAIACLCDSPGCRKYL